MFGEILGVRKERLWSCREMRSVKYRKCVLFPPFHIEKRISKAYCAERSLVNQARSSKATPKKFHTTVAYKLVQPK